MLEKFIARYIGVLANASEPKRQTEIIDAIRSSFSFDLTICTMRSYAYKINDVLDEKGVIHRLHKWPGKIISFKRELDSKEIDSLIIDVYEEIKLINRERTSGKSLKIENSSLALPKYYSKKQKWVVTVDRSEITVTCNGGLINTMPIAVNRKAIIELSEKAVIILE